MARPETASFQALAMDYDGTIAQDGIVDASTTAALVRLKASGRRLILVTGRELPDLRRVYPNLALFDRIVVENGAVLFDPATGREEPLAPPPPADLARRLQERGVTPLSVGRVVVATRDPHRDALEDTIRELGLAWDVIGNKGALMALPLGIDKASGLAAALHQLGIGPEAVVAVGDAENDLAFMRVCGCAVAVDNALAGVKAACDVVTHAARGAGVTQLIARWLADEHSLRVAAKPRWAGTRPPSEP